MNVEGKTYKVYNDREIGNYVIDKGVRKKLALVDIPKGFRLF